MKRLIIIGLMVFPSMVSAQNKLLATAEPKRGVNTALLALILIMGAIAILKKERNNKEVKEEERK